MAAKKPSKRPDLKKRLDEIRSHDSSQNPAALIVTLDAALYSSLERLAAERNQTLATCAADLIAAAIRDFAEK